MEVREKGTVPFQYLLANCDGLDTTDIRSYSGRVLYVAESIRKHTSQFPQCVELRNTSMSIPSVVSQLRPLADWSVQGASVMRKHLDGFRCSCKVLWNTEVERTKSAIPICVLVGTKTPNAFASAR